MRALQIVGGLVGLAILAANFADAWRELRAAPPDVAWGVVLAATVLLIALYLALAWLWTSIAGALGVRIPYRVALQFWSISNLGRYVPGKVWQITGVAIVASDLGVSPGLAVTIACLSFGFMVATGAWLGFALLPGLFASDALRLAVVGASAAAVAVPVAWPGIFPATMRRLPGRLRVTDVRAPSRGGVARMAVQFAAVWIAHGIAFWVFCAAFAPLAWRTVLPVTGAYCLAYVSGLVALIAPGGIGVREEILGATLAPVMPGHPVHVVAVAARVWTMAAELCVLAAALTLRLRRRRGS